VIDRTREAKGMNPKRISLKIKESSATGGVVGKILIRSSEPYRNFVARHTMAGGLRKSFFKQDGGWEESMCENITTSKREDMKGEALGKKFQEETRRNVEGASPKEQSEGNTEYQKR